MLEVYSKNIAVAADAPIALNNVALIKGASTELQGVSSILLNKCGIYQVSVNADATATPTGNVSIQLYKNNVAVPEAISTGTIGDASAVVPLAFTTLIQVPTNSNINCPCNIPTTIEIMNTGVAATFNSITVTVVRV